jgi:hypothetical protein
MVEVLRNPIRKELANIDMSNPCTCQEPKLEFYDHEIDTDLLPHWILARAHCSKCDADEKVVIALDDHWEWQWNND